MKKYVVYVALFILSLGVINLCVSNIKSLSDTKSEKILFRFNCKQGDVYKRRLISKEKLIFKKSFANPKLSSLTDLKYSHIIEDVDKDGNITIRTIYNSLKFELDGPTGKIKYDSLVPGSAVFPRIKAWDAIVGGSFFIIISPQGFLIEVKGIDKLIDRIREVFDEDGVVDKTGIIQEFEKTFSYKSIKESLRDEIPIYPDQSAQIGNSWVVKGGTTFVGIPVILDSIWKLKERKNGIATIEVCSEVSHDPKLDIYDISGKHEGIMKINEKTGLATNAEWKLSFSGYVNIENKRTGIKGNKTVTIEPY